MSANRLEWRTVRPWLHDGAALKQPREEGFAASAETSSNRASSHPGQRVHDSVDVQVSVCSGFKGIVAAKRGKSCLTSKHPSFIVGSGLSPLPQLRHTTVTTPLHPFQPLLQHCFLEIFGLHLVKHKSSLCWHSAMHRHTDPDFQLAANQSDPL